MTTPKRGLTWMIGAALLALAWNAAAQSVVTVCTTDNAPGGVNLRDAVAAGGRITFDCGTAATQLQITASLAVTRPIQIDGAGRIGLQGPVAGPLFNATSAVELANLDVSNAFPQAAGIVRGQQSEVTLRNVRTLRTASAYQVASLTAQDSAFESNGAAPGALGVIIDAERVHLTRSTFTGNLDHPVGGGLPAALRAPLSRTIVIEDSTFTENTASVLAYDAVLTVRGGRFSRNGAAFSATPVAWACCGGAITAVRSRVTVSDAEFDGNAAAGLGGAILAIGSDVRLARALFSDNQALAGGAVFSWAQPIASNAWSTQMGGDVTPGLSLSSSRFRGNRARFAGGAIAWSGSLGGDSALFARNQADVGGAIAHWSAVPLPADEPAFAGLIALTTNVPQRLDLARGAFVENQARAVGAAIAGGKADVALGNAVVVRNVLAQSGQGAAIEAEALTLSNATVAHNTSGGIRLLPSGRTATLLNTLVLQNASYGCSIDVAKLGVVRTSLQFPTTDCSGISVGNPDLDNQYKPSLGGPASDAGDLSTCLSAPLVAGVDVAGTARGNRNACAIGAYEPDPRIDPVTGWSIEDRGWVQCILFWMVLLLFLVGFLVMWLLLLRRRRRNAAH